MLELFNEPPSRISVWGRSESEKKLNMGESNDIGWHMSGPLN